MPSDRLFISPEVFNEMIGHTRDVYPEEACGILAGRDKQVTLIFKMTNIEHSPVSYLMDSREQFRVMKEIRQKGLDMLGIYHSHTSTDAYPSVRDINLAFYDVAYVIVSLAGEEPVARAFRILDQKNIEEIELIIR